ncbi:MAG: hypothetical protein H7Z72_13065 [Bacteroidetes bacterium]|nr:hypothetical protein [Fibrella sp.]
MAASFAAELNVTALGPAITLHTCTVSFDQSVTRKGRPAAGVRSGLIELEFLGKDRPALTQWAIDPLMELTGEIRFFDITGSTLQVLKFEDAYCVRYQEVFMVGGSDAAYVFKVGLTARKLFLGGSLHDSMWADWKMGS